MMSRFGKAKLRGLGLAIGLPGALIALFLACTIKTTPPIVAAPARSELGPAWTSSEPVTTVVLPEDLPWVWNIDRYDVTITFWNGSVKEDALFTFTPRPNLPSDPSIVFTPYAFELQGRQIDTGLSISLWEDIEYALHYDEAQLGKVSEHTLQVYRFSEQWYPIDDQVDTTANRITWNTNFTGNFGVGGLGPRKYLYLPAAFSASVRPVQVESPPKN
jgi:hypothetical protein